MKFQNGHFWPEHNMTVHSNCQTVNCPQEGTEQTLLLEEAYVHKCVEQDVAYLLPICCCKCKFLCSHLLGQQRLSQQHYETEETDRESWHCAGDSSWVPRLGWRRRMLHKLFNALHLLHNLLVKHQCFQSEAPSVLLTVTGSHSCPLQYIISLNAYPLNSHTQCTLYI